MKPTCGKYRKPALHPSSHKALAAKWGGPGNQSASAVEDKFAVGITAKKTHLDEFDSGYLSCQTGAQTTD